MSRFGRSGGGRWGRVLPRTQSWWRWDLRTLIKVAVAILLIGWISSTIIDLEARLRDTNRARDTLARELRQFRAAPASGLTGDAPLSAGSRPMNAPGPVGGATQAPPGKGGDAGKGKGASGTDGGGADGKEGKPGSPGDYGPSGKEGDPGPPGKDGDPGPTGIKGEAGDAGPAGKDGKDGTDGKDGDPGPPGKDGDPGPPGPRGDRGPEGPSGPTCPAGFSLQVPPWDADALVCRRGDRKQPGRPPTRAAKSPGSGGASS